MFVPGKAKPMTNTAYDPLRARLVFSRLRAIALRSTTCLRFSDTDRTGADTRCGASQSLAGRHNRPGDGLWEFDGVDRPTFDRGAMRLPVALDSIGSARRPIRRRLRSMVAHLGEGEIQRCSSSAIAMGCALQLSGAGSSSVVPNSNRLTRLVAGDGFRAAMVCSRGRTTDA